MPQRNSNFRKGDIAESLGLVLLQGIALVAPVPRSEDVGLDVVATLLRKADSYNLVAENSFYVQLKSKSERKIEFTGKRLSWLLELELPFFIGSVDISNSKIELFACHELMKAILPGFPLRKVILDLDSISSHSESPIDPTLLHIGIGQSVMNWSVEEMTASEFVDLSYDILKPHIMIAKRNIEHTNVQRFQVLEWNTNKIPIDSGNMTASYDGDLKHAMSRAMPYLSALATKFDRMGEERIVQKLLDVTARMHELGAEKDAFIEKLREESSSDNRKFRSSPHTILTSPPMSIRSNES